MVAKFCVNLPGGGLRHRQRGRRIREEGFAPLKELMESGTPCVSY
jgi:hypothetical protein